MRAKYLLTKKKRSQIIMATTRSKEQDVWAVVNELKHHMEQASKETQDLKRQLEQEKQTNAENAAMLKVSIELSNSNSTCATTPEEPFEVVLNRMTSALKEVASDRSALSLPESHGHISEWPKFKKEFDRLKEDRNIPLPNRLHMLRQKIKGDAAICVSRLMIEPENVDKIIERLEKEYGNVGIIYQTLLNDLLKVEKPSLQKPKSFITFMRALDDLIAYMVSLHSKEYLADQRLINDLVHRLPNDLKHRWYDYVIKGGKGNNLQELASWLRPTEEVAILLKANEQGENRTEEVISPRRYTQTSCQI